MPARVVPFRRLPFWQAVELLRGARKHIFAAWKRREIIPFEHGPRRELELAAHLQRLRTERGVRSLDKPFPGNRERALRAISLLFAKLIIDSTFSSKN